MLQKLGSQLLMFLARPYRVFILGFTLFFFTLIVDGSFFQLWSLHQHRKELEKNVLTIQLKNKELDLLLLEARSTRYVERQAREQLNLVADGDLMFVFTN